MWALYNAEISKLFRQFEMVQVSQFVNVGWLTMCTILPNPPLVGDIIEGEIVKHFEWGCTVKLQNGFIGRLSSRFASWSETRIPTSKLFPVGSSIKVIVRDINRSNKDVLHIRLGHREFFPAPYNLARMKYPEGSVIEGKVLKLRDYGAIVELSQGYNGLLHNSEISWVEKHVKASDLFSEGDIIPVKVITAHKSKRRLHLSYRETKTNPWDSITHDLPIGSRLKGRVLNIVEYGVFISLKNGLVGLLHNSQVKGSLEIIEGQIIEVEIVGINTETKRIALKAG